MPVTEILNWIIYVLSSDLMSYTVHALITFLIINILFNVSEDEVWAAVLTALFWPVGLPLTGFTWLCLVIYDTVKGKQNV